MRTQECVHVDASLCVNLCVYLQHNIASRGQYFFNVVFFWILDGYPERELCAEMVRRFKFDVTAEVLAYQLADV